MITLYITGDNGEKIEISGSLMNDDERILPTSVDNYNDLRPGYYSFFDPKIKVFKE